MYISLEGKGFEEDIKISNRDEREFFRVNLPDSEESYEYGSGEGVWAVSNSKGFRIAQDDNSYKELFLVRILNDSIYFKDLKMGDYVLVESRRDNRPVAIYKELVNRFEKTNWRETFR